MALPKIATANLLEQSGATVTVTDAATDNPKEHLFDRDLVFPWTAADASGDKEIKVDQGAGGTFKVDTALIAGHNLTGLTCFLEHSPDNTVWTAYDGGAGSFVAAAGIIELAISGGPLTKRYWRLRIIAPSSAPEVGEFFITEAHTFVKGYSYGATWGKDDNVTVNRSPGGEEFTAKRGDSQRTLDIEIAGATLAFRDALHSREEEAGVRQKPFFFTDEDGVRYWMKFARSIVSESPAKDLWSLSLGMMEAN